MSEFDEAALEALRDDATWKAEQARTERVHLERAWPAHHGSAPVEEAKRQLEALAEAWLRVAEWASQQIRTDSERDLM